MNTYATRANREINDEVNGGTVPQWAPLKATAPYQRRQPIVLRPVNDDQEMRAAVRGALVHHLQQRGVEWVLSVIADGLTNYAIRRLNTEDENRLRDYNLIAGYAGTIGSLLESVEELAGR